MPEQEFELYLSLLSRFLRLKPAQRDEIADELRDHLEERLEDLARRGLSRSEAIRAALDEFGDAAALAQHFTRMAHIRQRRLIMRVTFGTVAALAAALLVATAFWPESPQAAAPRVAVAQDVGAPAGQGQAKPQETAPVASESEKSVVETKLGKRIGKIEFAELPLGETLESLGEKIDVDILVDRETLTSMDISLDQPVSLKIKRGQLSGRTALDLVLEPLNLSYEIRDGVIMVTSTNKAGQIQVYNVRDLVQDGEVPMGGMGAGMMGGMGGWGMGGGMMAGGGMFNVEDSQTAGDTERIQLAQGFGGGMGGGGMGGMGGGGMGMGGGGMGGGMAGGPLRRTHSLAHVIAATIDQESWQPEGSGSIVQYHDLLVVKNNQAVHEKIRSLLEMMRTSMRENPPENSGDGAPAGKAPAAKAPAGSDRPGAAGLPTPTGGSPAFLPGGTGGLGKPSAGNRG